MSPENRAAMPGQSDEYAGRRLGLPENGVDSLASVLRRAGGTAIDWFIAEALVVLVFQQSIENPQTAFWVMGVWCAMGIVSVWLFSFTAGQLILGIRVVRVGANERVGLLRAAIRSLLMIFVVPALFMDRDGRGLHDQLSGTGVVRTR